MSYVWNRYILNQKRKFCFRVICRYPWVHKVDWENGLSPLDNNDKWDTTREFDGWKVDDPGL